MPYSKDMKVFFLNLVIGIALLGSKINFEGKTPKEIVESMFLLSIAAFILGVFFGLGQLAVYLINEKIKKSRQ